MTDAASGGGLRDVGTNRLFGFRLVSRTTEGAVVAVEPRPEFVQEGGVVHGGVLTTLADTAAVYCFLPDLDDGASMASIDLHLVFLRPATLDGGTIEARATVLREGGSVASCRVDVLQGDGEKGDGAQGEVVASGTFTYRIRRSGTRPPR